MIILILISIIFLIISLNTKYDNVMILSIAGLIISLMSIMNYFG